MATQDGSALRRTRTISITEELRGLVEEQRRQETAFPTEAEGERQPAAVTEADAVPSVASTSGACDYGVSTGSEASQSAGSWRDMINLSPRMRGLLLLNLLVVLMATNWVVVKEGGNSLDPFTFAFLRFGVAATAFLPFLKKATADKELVKAGLELGAWTAAGYLTQSLGLAYTDASRASFLSTFTVIVVPLISGFFGKGVKPFVWLSVAAAVFGVSLLEQSGTEFGVGDVWSFLSAVFFGIQVFRTEVLSRRLPPKQTLPLMSVVMLVIAAASGVAALGTHPDALGNMLSSEPLQLKEMLVALPWVPILYTGILSTDLALVCEFEALQDVSSVDAALVYTLEPVLGALLAWLLLGERWGPAGWVGAGLIVGSSFATQVYGADSSADSPDTPDKEE